MSNGQVRPEQVRGAIASLAMISPLGNPSPKLTETDGKLSYPGTTDITYYPQGALGMNEQTEIGL